MEQKCFANKQYSKKECQMQILYIPASVAGNGLESNILEFLKEIDAPIDSSLVEDCHRLPYQGPPKIVIIKLNRHKDICRILLNESELKNQKSESVKLHGDKKAFINESLFCTTRNCGPNAKSCGALITLPRFRPAMDCWESTCLNKSLSTITHDCDLEKLFPGNPLIEDNYSLIDFNISCCNNMCSCLSLLLDISFKAGCFPSFWKYHAFFFCAIFRNSTNESLATT